MVPIRLVRMCSSTNHSRTALQKSKITIGDRSVVLVLAKKDASGEYWSRLTKDKVKSPYIKVDWNKWKGSRHACGPCLSASFPSLLARTSRCRIATSVLTALLFVRIHFTRRGR